MHIVFVTSELATDRNPSGGLASFTANISRIFAQKGHEVTIILFSARTVNIIFDPNISVINVTAERLPCKDIVSSIQFLKFLEEVKRMELRAAMTAAFQSFQIRKEILELHKKKHIDIIHYSNLNAPALFSPGNIPYVIRLSSFYNMCRGAADKTYINDYNANPVNCMEKITNLSLRRARALISPSRFVAEISRKLFGDKVKVLESPYYLMTEKWNEEVYNQKLNGKQYILHYGSLGYLKGTHIVAEIARPILEKYKNMYIVMAGNGKALFDEEANENISAYELVKRKAGKYGNRVIYLGCLVREDLYPVIKHAEVCLLPSRIDNLPNTCIEAMAMGKLVIGTNGASYEQLITDGKNGFLGERDDAESFLKAVYRVMEMDDREKKEMIKRSQERIRLLAPDHVYKKYLNCYKEIIQKW